MFTKKNLHLCQHLIDYNIYQFMCPLHGFGDELEKNSGVKLDTFIFVKEKRDTRFYFNMAEWKKIGKKYFELILRDPEKALNLINKIILSATEIFKFSKIIPNVNKLKKISDLELYKIYQKFYKYHHQIWTLAMPANLVEAENSFVIDYITNIVEKNKNKWNLNLPTHQIVDTLIFSDQASWLEKKNKDYFKLLIKLKPKPKNEKQFISAFYQKYAWMEYNWSGPLPEREVLRKQIKADLKKKIDYQKKLGGLEKERQAKIREKNQYLKLIDLSKKDKIIIKMLEKLYFSKGYRLDCCYFTYYQMERVFKETARRLYLTMNQARSIIPVEMKNYLVKRKIDVDRLNQLYNQSVIFWNGKEIKIYLSQKAKKFKDSMTEEDLVKGKEVKELTGQIAYRGQAKGEVKIINQRSEIQKFKKGNILVSGHTDPTLMPAIIKAAAIVTDFGGMTCHAAIVARELKIPCVVGTKIATKVLHDGDRVEVDANKGVIKIIKRAKK